MIKVVVFDLDGTLLNTLDDLADSTNYVLSRRGFPTHPLDAYRYFVGNGIAKLIERALPENHRDKATIQAVLNEFVPYYSDHKADKTSVYPGMIELLKTLQQKGIQIAVASNKVHSAMQPLMDYYFPEIHFAAVLGQREGVPVKPDAAIVNDIMSHCGVKRSEVLYVGDTSVDMQTAANARVTSVGVLWGFRDRNELEQSGAQYIIEKSEELLSVIDTLNSYEKITDHIFQCLPMYHKIGTAAYKEGLENIETLMDILDHPEKKLRTIHVTGTNGKGSVTHLLSSYFQELGYKTGLYTSPHLVDFRERIKINGRMMTKEAVVDFFKRHWQQFEQIEPSFFEMTTAMAFDYFASEHVDIAIIEVGLGGRLDATNVITPDLSVITNISLEHTALLGDTLAKIAFEKAGIIKPGVPVVIGEYNKETMPVFQEVAASRHAPLFTADEVKVKVQSETAEGKRVAIEIDNNVVLSDVFLPLQGDYQLKNVATCVAALLALHRPMDATVKRAFENVLTNTHLLGRWQIMSQHPLVVCDTGHNAGGWVENGAQLRKIRCKQLRMVIGFANDKDVDKIVTFLPENAFYYLCKAEINRALPPEEMLPFFEKHNLNVQLYQTVDEAYKAAVKEADPDDMIYIGGSNFVVGEWMEEYGEI